MNLNPELTDPNQINVGQRIRLPGESQALQASVNAQVTPVTEKSTLEKWGETAKDFVEDKAGDYAEKWANNRINNAIYGEATTDTSIGFHNWKEVGTTIDVRTFFEQGDNYTPSLAAFYDEAENAFNSPAVGRI